MNLPEAIQLIAVLQESYPKFPFTEKSPVVWSWALEEVEYETAMNAVKIAIKTRPYCPVPAEIYEIIGQMSPIYASWEDAWAEVTACRKKHGVYVGPRFRNDGGQWSSPLVEAALRHIGGYLALCEVETKNEPTMRAQFREAYERARTREVVRFYSSNARPALRADLTTLDQIES